VKRLDTDALGRLGFAYDARAERRAWALAMALLDEVFEMPGS